MNKDFKLKKILDLFFPHACVNCHQIGTLVCDNCLTKLTPCFQNHEQNIYTAFDYDNQVVKKLIWQLKYKNTKESVEILTPYLYDYLLEIISEIKQINYFPDKILIIPVPLHFTRKWRRGYNQAEVIAKALVQLDPNTFELKTNILKRSINTKPQTKIHKKADRIKNIHEAFAIRNPEVIKKRLILVVDDVTTTGATLNECVKVLQKAGAGLVIQSALASKEKMW